MQRTTAYASATAILAALLMTAPAANAQPGQTAQQCRGDVEVQIDVRHNYYSCDQCAGSIIVQVGLDNDVDCAEGCRGNIVVQVGDMNDLQCVALDQASASAGFPCPKPLPEDNFYCHLAARLLPEEVCLSLDFCLW